MHPLLIEFCSAFEHSFHPPIPARGKRLAGWFVSGVWSDYAKTWLGQRYCVQWEVPVGDRRRLDAALWSGTAGRCPIDIALEWEWDNNKVAREFASGDFRKILAVDARCGLAIVQTRADGKRGATQADNTMRSLHSCCAENRLDKRSVAVIEIRRVRQSRADIEFSCALHDMHTGVTRYIAHWLYK